MPPPKKNGRHKAHLKLLLFTSLSPLVRRIREQQLQDIVDKLCEYLVDKKEESRDIATLGMKTVIVEIPSASPIAGNLMKRLIPRLHTLMTATVRLSIFGLSFRCQMMC
jgi:transcriptional regulator CtsR